jgi:protein AaeX
MSYAEVNIFGVYVAPIVPMMIVAWLLLWPLHRLAAFFGLFHYVWHPALFVFAFYVLLLAGIVLLARGLFV